MKTILTAALSLIFLAGCEETINNGVIPDKYLSAASSLVGVYNGQFAGQPMELILQINNQNQAVLSVQDENGETQLVAKCASKVGPLLSIEGDSQTQKIETAHFEFDGPACGLRGTTVDVSFRNLNQVKLRIVKHIQREESGDMDCSDNVRGRMHCRRSPGRNIIDEQLLGAFIRR
ncbi:MAG: hypothetical protein ABL927_03625 [Bdellovibrionales bacterium]